MHLHFEYLLFEAQTLREALSRFGRLILVERIVLVLYTFDAVVLGPNINKSLFEIYFGTRKVYALSEFSKEQVSQRDLKY